eukprot:GFUD01043208.1.p1 GENE.GFUD01043208.1~~GFUD01043208.1.p1  ORF type:complete len:124 (-),score=34.96 GFUD01043208.1:102-473(-)
MHVSLVIICGMLGLVTASTWEAAPYTLFREKRSPQRTRFFTGNNAVDAGAAGAALGVATQYFANQIFNPCTRTRGGTRGGTRNKNTNNRIFGGQTLQNGLLGFGAGFAGASLVNSALGNPCGK